MQIPESVILDMQERAYQRKKQLETFKEVVATKQQEYVKAQHAVAVAEHGLREVADFLQQHNSEAVDSDSSWHAELGL